MNKVVVLWMLLAVAGPVRAAGYWFSGQEMFSALQGCERVAAMRAGEAGEATDEELRLARECLLVQGYVQGVADGIARNPAFALTVCTPGNATPVDLWNVVYEWMETHPDDRAAPAPVVIEQALKASWPCEVRAR